MNLKHIDRLRALPRPQRHIGHSHVWRHAAMNRRQFLKAGAATMGALALTPALAGARRALASNGDPRWIPQGNDFLGDGTTYHVELPGYPFFPDNDPAEQDPSLITDFNGHVGLAYVQGTGARTDKVTGEVLTLPFEVDLRFMKGTYVGLDGRHHHGAFALF